MINKAVLFFDNLEDFHLYKDVGMFPVYLSKYNYTFDIVCLKSEKNSNLPKVFNHVNIIRINPINIFNKIPLLKRLHLPQILYIIKNYKNIDLIFFFHLTLKKLSTASIYKFLKPNGKIYLKLDMDLVELENFKRYMKDDHSRKKRIIKLLNLCNLVTSEIPEVKRTINEYIINKTKTVVEHLTNGIDISSLKDIKVKSNKEKLNQIITVCRVGTKQKNNLMFLDALQNVDLNNWIVKFIGPIEDSFVKEIETFYKNNPDKQNNVLFLGSVHDKKELFEHYNNSKVFFLTSIREGFPLATLESMYFGNYLIQTPTGNENEVIPDDSYGTMIEINNISSLINILNKIISNKQEMKSPKEISERTITEFSYNVLAKKIDRMLN